MSGTPNLSGDFVQVSSGALHDARLYGYPNGAQNYSGEAHATSARARKLALNESYFRNRQHDAKSYTWDGCIIPAFEPGHQPPLSTAKVEHFVPLSQRRPCAPYRLTRFIVRAFTSLLFGEGRNPEVRVVGDPDTQDYLAELCKAADLFGVFDHARDVGGSSGTVAISWRIWDGEPRLRVHPGSTVHVQSWVDREQHVVEVATCCVRVQKEVYDAQAKGFVMRDHWHRVDWTPMADVVFVDQPTDAEDKSWVIDEEATIIHNEGRAHLVWIPNMRDYDDASADGEADFEGVVEMCDAIDVAFSAAMYGGAKNIEPTLLLGLPPEMLDRIRRVEKGADRALPVGTGGTATYLELSGTSISTGLALVDRARSAVLECAQVVAPDPDKVAAAGSSSVALKMLYAPMLAPAARLRTRYGTAIVRLLTDMLRAIRLHTPGLVPEEELTAPSLIGADQPEGEGEEQAGEELDPEELFVRLPPRVIEEAVVDPETGQPTGEVTVREVPRRPGKGGSIELAWPDWFPPTADDRQKEVTTLSAAAGGKPTVSHKGAVEKTAALLDLDPAEEWREVTAQVQAEREAQTAMFPAAGLPAPPPGDDRAP